MARVDDLKAKLKAREGKPGHRENVRALKREIARLEAKPIPTDEELAAEEEPK